MVYNILSPMRDSLQKQNAAMNNFRTQNDEMECSGDWVPSVDVKETSEKLVLYVEVPGMRKQDIRLSVQEQVLSISGDKIQSESAHDENIHRAERLYGKFCRRFALPRHVDVKRINAELVNGVLTVTLPKQEQARAQEIKIS